MQIGDILNHTYRILSPIGQGGLGTIYLAYHENLQKYVVVKKIRDQVMDLVNCRLEVDILKSLHHQYLPQVYDFIQMSDGVFTVMDYIPGNDMKYYLDHGWQFSEKQLCLWLRQLCEVLEYLHSQKLPVIHCDIKPANIMITTTGDICLIDFNISLDGENNKDLVGVSSEYAAPEQIRKARALMSGLSGSEIKIDPRTDIYSLGAVFYRLISGQSPNERRENRIRLTDIVHPYSGALAGIIDKAMMNDPARRFKSAGQFMEALDHMEEWSHTWKRLTAVGRIADGAMALLSLILVCLMIVGYKNMVNEQFFDAYETYINTAQVLYSPMADGEDFVIVQEEGLALLNDSRWTKLFNKNAVEKANVLYSVGQAALGAEDYIQALTCMEKAAEYNPVNPDIYRDIAIVRAVLLDFEQADICLNKARALGLPEQEVALVKAQIAYVSGDDAQAYTLAVEAAEAADGELVQRAAALAVNASERLGNYSECLSFAKQMAAGTRGPQAMLWLQNVQSCV